MTIYYSASAGGFFDTDLADYTLPADKVELTADEHTALLTALASGKVLQVGSDGKPAAVTPAATLASRLADLAAQRYAREIAGVNFKASGASAAQLFPTDRESQAKLAASYATALQGHWTDGTPWKISSATFVPLTAADVEALEILVIAYVSACYAREAALAAALATDLTTDITTGWPSQG